MAKNVTKQELIDSCANAANVTKIDAGKVLEAIIENIQEALADGQGVGLVGFGTFSVSERAARTGRNPQTGEAIKIKAAKVAKFKAGKNLKDAVNK